MDFLSLLALVFPFPCHLCKLQFEVFLLIRQLASFHTVAFVTEELPDKDFALHTSAHLSFMRREVFAQVCTTQMLSGIQGLVGSRKVQM